MKIDKTNLTEDEGLKAEQCENAINQIYAPVVGALAVLESEGIYLSIKDKLNEEADIDILLALLQSTRDFLDDIGWVG